MATVSLTGQDENPLSPVKLPLKTKDQETETRENVVVKKSLQRITITGSKKFMSGSLLPDNVLSPNKLVANGERY